MRVASLLDMCNLHFRQIVVAESTTQHDLNASDFLLASRIFIPGRDYFLLQANSKGASKCIGRLLSYFKKAGHEFDEF